ncbi:MAG TPA: NAD-dependent epimerase/dehydratase family protein [Solirubrobacterales bacterium]|nr:NAD-dependent epimerase/dehydratase family protein [Solirubrobacterales bacterium]
MSRALVTGGAGFIGTNLSNRLLERGERVRILDDLSRPGVERNLAWLESRHGDRVETIVGDVGDPEVVGKAILGVDSAFHLAAQVAVTTSLDAPLHDFEVNLRGTINLLEAARTQARPPALLFTSTNKVYGGLEDVELHDAGGRYEPVDRAIRRSGISEARPLDFCTPYGCSKGAADQYVLDYAKSYGLRTAVFRMSCIYGPHQCGNEDQGWVAHFAISALEGKPMTLFGDGHQVRDVLYVDDLVEAFLAARKNIDLLGGHAYNIGGGPANAVSLCEVIERIGELAGEAPEVRFGPWRQGDQRYYVTDTSRFQEDTGWRPRVAADEGIERLYEWLSAERGAGSRSEAAPSAV